MGGQPFIHSGKDGNDNSCRTMEKTMNYSGLWIFTRSSTRDQEIVDKVLEIAVSQGFDISILNDVQQEGCSYIDEDKDNDKHNNHGKSWFSGFHTTKDEAQLG